MLPSWCGKYLSIWDKAFSRPGATGCCSWGHPCLGTKYKHWNPHWALTATTHSEGLCKNMIFAFWNWPLFWVHMFGKWSGNALPQEYNQQWFVYWHQDCLLTWPVCQLTLRPADDADTLHCASIKWHRKGGSHVSSHCLIQGFAPESMCLSSHDCTCFLGLVRRFLKCGTRGDLCACVLVFKQYISKTHTSSEGGPKNNCALANVKVIVPTEWTKRTLHLPPWHTS